MSFRAVRLFLLPAAPLRHHVAPIVGRGAKPKVTGIDALGIVAGMANLEAIRNSMAIGELPRKPRSALSAWIGEVAISVSVMSAEPRPAFIRSTAINLGPKPDFWRKWRTTNATAVS
jgi:hypothetical protein